MNPVHLAVRPCWLGRVLVAGGERGLLAILLGEGAVALVRELFGRFPGVPFLDVDAALDDRALAFGALADDVATLLERPAACADLPLDVRGTAFQRRVWRALREIPPGETRTSTELAAAVGDPGAARAVAAACAANVLAVAIPCHRAIRADGGLGGWRWGPERKRALLEREAAQARAAAEEGRGARPGAAGAARDAVDEAFAPALAGSRPPRRPGRR